MSKKPTAPRAVPDPLVYTEVEAQALDLAAELRDRVQRERAVVRRLQSYLAGHREPHGVR